MTFLYLLLLMLCSLLHYSFSIQSTCSNDTNCNYGLCIPVGTSNFCSCLSGFGGSNCLERPSLNCTYNAVSYTSSNFQPNTSIEYQYPNLNIEITMNLEQTIFQNPSLDDTKVSYPPYSQQLIVVFGNGSFHKCNFPNNQVNWNDLAALNGDCQDRIKLSISWTQAKDLCGFFPSISNRVYEQTILVQRYYLLDSSRGFNVTRIDSRTFTLQIT